MGTPALIIKGEIPLNYYFFLKWAGIEGEIPSIDSKYSKIGAFFYITVKPPLILPKRRSILKLAVKPPFILPCCLIRP
ncbi:hypothetical protein [Peribacillus kribbensis]|uniref:hypothetical protein n=1 Tax=Peribacillus kribbensis TaxID=356658 RepID=UPI0004798F1B|nr:hypothetical protein [Peribacillus kribbensis]